jgi:hypothetical protein
MNIKSVVKETQICFLFSNAALHVAVSNTNIE